MLDVDNPDPDMFPDFQRATHYECILYPGDVLFIPGNSPHFAALFLPINLFHVAFWLIRHDPFLAWLLRSGKVIKSQGILRSQRKSWKVRENGEYQGNVREF